MECTVVNGAPCREVGSRVTERSIQTNRCRCWQMRPGGVVRADLTKHPTNPRGPLCPPRVLVNSTGSACPMIPCNTMSNLHQCAMLWWLCRALLCRATSSQPLYPHTAALPCHTVADVLIAHPICLSCSLQKPHLMDPRCPQSAMEWSTNPPSTSINIT